MVIIQEPEKSHDVQNNRLIIKAAPRHKLIRDVLTGQFLNVSLGRIVGTHEDREVRPIHFFALGRALIISRRIKFSYPAGDKRLFVMSRFEIQEADRSADFLLFIYFSLRNQILIQFQLGLQAIRIIILDEAIGMIEDGLARAVIFRQDNFLGLRIIILKLHDIG